MAAADRPKRKRPRNIHERQELINFFDEEGDMAHEQRAPVELIARMGVGTFGTPGDFYDDLEDVRKAGAASFGRMPKDLQQAVVEGVQDMAGCVERHVVGPGDEDPSAIVVADTHMHELMPVPDRLPMVPLIGRRANVATTTDPMELVKPAHRAEMCMMPEYDSVETVITRLRFASPKTAAEVMTAAELVRTFRSCQPNSIVRHRADAREVYFVFELDHRGVFYMAVRMKVVARPEAEVPEHARWSSDLAQTLGDSLKGTLAGYAYFECGCV